MHTSQSLSSVCRATTKAGNPCPAWAIRGTDLCAGHSGKGIAASPDAAREAAHRKNAAARERKAAQAAARAERDHLHARGITSRLRAHVAENADEIIRALLAPVSDDSLSPLQRQRAALELLSRAFGRPATAELPPETSADMPVESVLAAWTQADEG